MKESEGIVHNNIVFKNNDLISYPIIVLIRKKQFIIIITSIYNNLWSRLLENTNDLSLIKNINIINKNTWSVYVDLRYSEEVNVYANDSN